MSDPIMERTDVGADGDGYCDKSTAIDIPAERIMTDAEREDFEALEGTNDAKSNNPNYAQYEDGQDDPEPCAEDDHWDDDEYDPYDDDQNYYKEWYYDLKGGHLTLWNKHKKLRRGLRQLLRYAEDQEPLKEIADTVEPAWAAVSEDYVPRTPSWMDENETYSDVSDDVINWETDFVPPDNSEHVDEWAQCPSIQVYSCPKCNVLWNDYLHGHEYANSLAVRTGLRDGSFRSSDNPASKCSIRYNDTFRILQKALLLAQDTLWCAMRKHWPEAQLSYYPWGPRQVRFGRGEIESAMGSMRRPLHNDKIENYQCQGPYLGTIQENMICLRNSVCHPSPDFVTPGMLDSSIQDVQKMAVLFKDEARARKCRALRDEVIALQKKAYADIVAHEPFADNAKYKTWAIHHQMTFREYMVKLSRSDKRSRKKLDPVLRRAAIAWYKIYGEVGRQDPDHLKRVAEKKAYIDSLESEGGESTFEPIWRTIARRHSHDGITGLSVPPDSWRDEQQQKEEQLSPPSPLPQSQPPQPQSLT